MKRAILEISDDLFMVILKGFKAGFSGQFKVADNALPIDTRIVRVNMSSSPENTLMLLLESEEFKDIENGELYPVLTPPSFEVIYGS